MQKKVIYGELEGNYSTEANIPRAEIQRQEGSVYDVESSNSSSQGESTQEDSPPSRVRMLRDIYESCSFALHMSDPSNYDEACQNTVWKKAMDEEFQAIQRNDTWDLVAAPMNKKIIGLKWIYKTKFNANGEVQNYKARLVARGYVQEKGIDYEDVFFPVARLETVKLILSIAAHKEWQVYHMDVKSAAPRFHSARERASSV